MLFEQTVVLAPDPCPQRALLRGAGPSPRASPLQKACGHWPTQPASQQTPSRSPPAAPPPQLSTGLEGEAHLTEGTLGSGEVEPLPHSQLRPGHLIPEARISLVSGPLGELRASEHPQPGSNFPKTPDSLGITFMLSDGHGPAVLAPLGMGCKNRQADLKGRDSSFLGLSLNPSCCLLLPGWALPGCKRPPDRAWSTPPHTNSALGPC